MFENVARKLQKLLANNEEVTNLCNKDKNHKTKGWGHLGKVALFMYHGFGHLGNMYLENPRIIESCQAFGKVTSKFEKSPANHKEVTSI